MLHFRFVFFFSARTKLPLIFALLLTKLLYCQQVTDKFTLHNVFGRFVVFTHICAICAYVRDVGVLLRYSNFVAQVIGHVQESRVILMLVQYKLIINKHDSDCLHIEPTTSLSGILANYSPSNSNKMFCEQAEMCG